MTEETLHAISIPVLMLMIKDLEFVQKEGLLSDEGIKLIPTLKKVLEEKTEE